MADLRYQAGRFYQNDAERFSRASNYAVADFGGSVRLYRQAELQAGVQNALDRNDFLVDGYPEAGSTAFVNLRYRF